MLRRGERIGDWIIEAPLGEGGMGAVYRVHSALTQRLVAALKVMKPTDEPDARARFVREAEALSALRHPAVVRVMGFSEDRDRGLLYLVMELAVGETLRSRMARGPMPLPEALATFVPLAQGLDHAHAAGIFHRDLKPSNVVLCVDGTPRLVDFGIAAALHAEPLTTTGQLGTLPYLPPEVFRGERADPAAIDVYAFGLLLHEALTGQRSFAADPSSTPAAAAAAIGVRKLQSTGVELPEGFPDRLRDLVQRSTATDPAGRPTMHELRAGLESAVERRAAGPGAGRLVPVMAAPAAADEATTRVPDPTSVPLAGPPSGSVGSITGSRGTGRRRSDRTRARLLAVAAVAAALLALALALSARHPASGSADGRPHAEPAAVNPAPTRRLAPAAPRSARPSARASRSPSASPSASAAAPSATPAASPPAARQAQAKSSPPPSPAAETTPPTKPAGARAAPRPAASEAGGDDDEPAARDGAREAPRGEGDADRSVAARSDPGQVAGRWELVHEVESTSYHPYEGLKLGYRLNLFQEGNRVYGQGRKVSENGVMLPPGQRTPIDVAGRIEDGQVVLYFTEIGRERTSRGTIRWYLDPDSPVLHGRFATDAADSSGTSLGRRMP